MTNRNHRPGHIRPARGKEPAFYGGPLDGSFDFVPSNHDILEWPSRVSNLIHVYERDITGRMCHQGLKRSDTPGATE